MVKRLRKKNRVGLATVVALRGGLGAGKTTFIHGAARALGVRRRITSPTFLIIRFYPLPQKDANSKSLQSQKPRNPGTQKFRNLVHIDAYRLQFPRELLAIGFKEIVSDPENIIFIEWAEKVKNILPKNTLWLNFDYGKMERERIISAKMS